jgi:DNA-binding CsgD family transcriptional regulator
VDGDTIDAVRPCLVDIVEACYQVDGEVDDWMKTVGEALDAHHGYGQGSIAIRYHLGNDFSFQPLTMVTINLPMDRIITIQRVAAMLSPDYVRATFASVPAAMARSAGSAENRDEATRAFREHFEPIGWQDIAVVNGLDPTQHGLYFGAFMARRGTLTARMRARWSRIAAHVAAANRLRTRLSANELRSVDAADAVLTPSGHVEHASGDAKLASARDTLAEGVRMIDRARGKLRRTDPDLALAEWRALLAARWTLVDHFESDGKRYVLARRNAPVPTGLDALTTRERQALGFAQLRHSNKLIAYEMGISASTVAVLLYRAAKKLGCDRDELVETYTRMLTTRS